MVAALLSSILKLLEIIAAEEAKQRGTLVGDVAEEFTMLSNKLKDIIDVLEDADKKMSTDREYIRGPMDKLTDAAYDLVDVLDEWITTLRINGVGKTSNLKAKVGSYVTHFFHTDQVVTPGDLAFKLKGINHSLNLMDMAVGTVSVNLGVRFKMRYSRFLTHTTDVSVSELVGRDKVIQDIVRTVLYWSTEEGRKLVKTICVVGMGGLGKTTVAEQVYSEVRSHFHNGIWVCVSDVFDEKKVAKAIIAQVERVAVDSLDSFPLVTLHERIRRSVSGNKFFLVLDDVCTNDMRHWEAVIQNFEHGAQGTFYGMGVEARWDLEDFGRRISKKCKGLPLAAKTLGGLLRVKSSREGWETILNTEIWALDTAHQKDFVSLLLSYYDLPLPLKQCFKYCAVFPEDFEYDGETIIYHWMAQRYLGWDNDKDLELKGREYISYLAACSFFQDFLPDTDSLKSTWKMHDIMHDFAEFLMNNDEIVIEVMNPGGNSMIDLSATKARYLTALIPEGCCLPTSIYGAEKLHSLVIISGENAITNEAVQIIFNQAKRLRLVDFGCHNALVDTIPKEIGNLIHLSHINLSGSKIKELPRSLFELPNLQYLNLDNCESLENLPDEIGNLINLRHINFSGSKIKGLPGSLCKLHNLRYLNLNNCKALEDLPNQIGKLIKLIHLGTLHCDRLACYPKSARRLTNLRQLHGIVLRADRDDPKEFALGDLENLDHLRELSMVLKGNAVNERELKRAKFENKTHLKEIKVE
ncbi:hypothetical protein SLEP1_g57348 [Rubroshorea leprosula]|uniref:Uncharacterized protein n=1 Tax=Rubroshorea leprosula TaxID=152421 RepID=A0AAV5MPY3_9ROSI|nr:hypothetical protein SLEP1_g57348 [Rubroshorea leprosula]